MPLATIHDTESEIKSITTRPIPLVIPKNRLEYAACTYNEKEKWIEKHPRGKQ
jgi:hypothetical protein